MLKIARTVPYVIRLILGAPHRPATVAARYAEGQLSTFGVAAVRRPALPSTRRPRQTAALGTSGVEASRRS